MINTRSTRIAELATCAIVALVFTTACELSGGGDAQAEGSRAACRGEKGAIRIGYPVTTLVNGQIGQVFVKTDVLKKNGLKGKVIPFTSGPPANEAMAANEIDIQLTSEGPAVQAMLQGVDSVVVASLGTTRDALVTKRSKGFTSIKDLKGRKIGVPVGTTPYLHLNQALMKAGMDPKKDVTLVNIPANGLAAALETDSVDAVEYNEPLPTSLEATGGKVVSTGELAYAIAVRRQYLNCHGDEVVDFLRSVAQSAVYMSRNRELVNGWFAEISRTEPGIIDKAARHSPIYTQSATIGDVNIGIDDVYKERLQNIDFFADLARKPTLSMADRASNSAWEKASSELRDSGPVQLTVTGD